MHTRIVYIIERTYIFYISMCLFVLQLIIIPVVYLPLYTDQALVLQSFDVDNDTYYEYTTPIFPYYPPLHSTVIHIYMYVFITTC